MVTDVIGLNVLCEFLQVLPEERYVVKSNSKKRHQFKNTEGLKGLAFGEGAFRRLFVWGPLMNKDADCGLVLISCKQPSV